MVFVLCQSLKILTGTGFLRQMYFNIKWILRQIHLRQMAFKTNFLRQMFFKTNFLRQMFFKTNPFKTNSFNPNPKTRN